MYWIIVKAIYGTKEIIYIYVPVNIINELEPEQNGIHFAWAISMCVLFTDRLCILIQINWCLFLRVQPNLQLALHVVSEFRGINIVNE